MYKRMAEEAREEGFEELAKKFEGVAEVEAAHERRYRKVRWKAIRQAQLLRRKPLLAGSAETADISLSARKPGRMSGMRSS